MHTHPSTSTNALFLLLLLVLLLLLLQTTAGGEIKHQPQPSATRKDVASDCDCCEEDEEGLLFQRQPRAPAIATAERCGDARSFPRTETNLDREDRTGLREPASPHAGSQHRHAFGTQKVFSSEDQGRDVFLRAAERPREGAGRLPATGSLVREERLGFFLCCLL